MSANDQLGALARIDRLFEEHAIEYWLFGGWAVDFYAGSITRVHADIDLAVWQADYQRLAPLLMGDGWRHTPDEGEDGYTTYERCSVRLELAFLARDTDRRVYTPLAQGRASWPEAAFEDDTAQLHAVRARVISLSALKADKAEARDDADVAAKDQQDLATLRGRSRVTGGAG